MFNARIVSSDKIREEFNIDSYDEQSNKRTFKILNKIVRNTLKNGEDCVYDATNINANKRIKFLNSLKDIDCEKICVVQIKDIEGCVGDNVSRGLHVPNDVIYRMYSSFNFPRYDEGWDKCILSVMAREFEDIENTYLKDKDIIKKSIADYCKKHENINEQIMKVVFLNKDISKKHTENANKYSDAYDFVVNHSHLVERHSDILLMIARLISYYSFFTNLDKRQKERFKNKVDENDYNYLMAVEEIQNEIYKM